MCKELADIESWFRKEINEKNKVLWDAIEHKTNEYLASVQFVKIFFSEMLLDNLQIMVFISNSKEFKNSLYIVILLRSMTEQIIECLYLLEHPNEIQKYLGINTKSACTNSHKKNTLSEENISDLSKILLRYRGGSKRKSIKEMTDNLKEENDLYEIYSVLSEEMHNIYYVSLREDVENIESPMKHDLLFDDIHIMLLQAILEKFLEEFNKGSGLTICLLVYNEQDYLEETLKYAIKNYELADCIYISDNCSTDNSVKIIEQYAKKYSKIILFQHTQMQPAAKHMLWLLQQVKTEYVLFLRPKNILSENFIQQCINKLRSCPDAVATYADAYFIGQEQRLALTNGKEIDHADAFYHEVICLESNDVRERIEILSRNGGTSVIYHVCRTEALLESVMHSEWEENGGDNIIALRMALLGKWLYVNEAKYYYYCRQETWAEISQRYRSNGFYVAEKNPYWYVPLDFLKICRLKIPELLDEDLKKKILLNFRLRGMELYDEDWNNRHTKGWLISIIKEKSEGKEIVVFGAGDYGKKFMKKIQSRLSVNFFIDNDCSKWGKEIFSKKICNPCSVQSGNYIVCIASSKYQYLQEMVKQMESYGYVYFDNLFCLAGEVPFECL